MRRFGGVLTAAVLALAASLAVLAGAFRPPVKADVLADGGGGGQPAALLVQLAARLETHPRDARAWALNARLLSGEQRYAEAANAYGRALALPGKVRRDAKVWCEYADASGMLQGGSLAGRPRELIEQALAIDPRQPCALELAGSAAFEVRDYASALRYWEELLGQLPADSPRSGELARAVERLRLLAGR